LGGGGEVKALLVLRHEATNVLERAVVFFLFPMAYNVFVYGLLRDLSN
jgi:hypothetical protein